MIDGVCILCEKVKSWLLIKGLCCGIHWGPTTLGMEDGVLHVFGVEWDFLYGTEVKWRK